MGEAAIAPARFICHSAVKAAAVAAVASPTASGQILLI
jgi:hypothetical protein